QSKMFGQIEEHLKTGGLKRYEISNFAVPGFESKHNSMYWENKSYLGFGLGSHSYMRSIGNWGTRFWNPRHMNIYSNAISQSDNLTNLKHLPFAQIDTLNAKSALSEFFMTSLRTSRGFSVAALQERFKLEPTHEAWKQLSRLVQNKLLSLSNDQYKLTADGIPLSDQVFRDLTFI
ncbi:MAG: hypothetical protein KDD25_07450, partial [Bdellovibrionales bacterium]|nr:hypothetical protein [Bdellovibrionales bacterium]